MISIKLISTKPVPHEEGRFEQVWEVNGKSYTSQAEWGACVFWSWADVDTNVGDHDPSGHVLIEAPKVTAHDVIVLAIHGNGPTQDQEAKSWRDDELVAYMRDHGYLFE